MEKFFKSAIGRFRAISFIEGVSYLVLLFIAMPLKYIAGFPLAVKVTGWIHGLLFLMYVLALLQVSISNKWSLLKTTMAFLASLLPFATFALEAKILRKEHELILSSK